MKEMDGMSYAIFVIGTVVISGSAAYLWGLAASFMTTGFSLVLIAVLLGERR